MNSKLINNYKSYFRIVEKQNRRSLINSTRNSLIQTLNEKMQNLKMEGPKNVSELIPITDSSYYKIKTIPKGQPCLMICQNNTLIIKKNGKIIRKHKIGNLPNFIAKVICNKEHSIYYVTNFQIFKNYNYKNLSDNLKDYLLKNHFNSKYIYQNEKFKVVRIIAYHFSIALFNSIIANSDNFFCLKLIATKDEISSFLLYNEKYFDKIKLKFPVRNKEGSFYFFDDVKFIASEGFALKDDINYKVEIQYKDIQGLNDYLNSKKTENQNRDFIEEIHFDVNKIKILNETSSREIVFNDLLKKVNNIALSKLF